MNARRWLALPLAALLSATAFAGKENLVKNGSFEKGLDGWTVNDETSTMKVDVDAKTGAEGKASAHVVKPASKGISNDRLVFELTKLPRGKKVVVSAQLKGKDLQNTWLKFFAFDAKGEPLIEDCDLGRVTGTFDWRKMERTFELPKEAVRAEIRFCMFLGGEAWLDDVRVVGDAAAATESSPATASTPSAAAPLDAAVKKWLDDNAVRVKTLDMKAPFDDLAPLKETLKDARIVQLGENTHGDGACFEAKARLIRFLHEEMGFEVLAFESGLWECDGANALLKSGDADGAMRSSIFPIWHTTSVSGLFRYLAGEAKSGKPLVLAGFDCRRSAGESNRFLEELAEFLAPAGKPDAADLAALKKLETLMWEQGDEYKPSAEDVSAASAAWTRLRKSLDDGRAKLVEKHGEAETAFVSRALDNWKANEAFERSKTDKSIGEHGSNNLRDTQMASNLRWLAETRYPGKKIVTWGATFHLAHGLAGVKFEKETDPYAGCTNMGGNVHEAFGKSVYTVGFAAFGGKAGTRFTAKPFSLSAPKEGSAEDLLHRYGAPFLFVDLRRDGPFGKPMRMAPMSYDRTMEARWPDVLDAVFFIDEMTPAR